MTDLAQLLDGLSQPEIVLASGAYALGFALPFGWAICGLIAFLVWAWEGVAP